MKKGFTLSEMLLALVIVGILASILIPNLMRSLPEKNKYLYRAAFKDFSNTVNELIEDEALYPDDNLESASADAFCLNFASKVNTVGAAPTCPSTCASTANDPCFTTSNGMNWWLPNNTFATSTNKNIYVDINGSEGSKVLGTDLLRIYINRLGKISVSDTPEQGYLQTNS